MLRRGLALDTSRSALELPLLTSSGVCQNTQKTRRETRLFYWLPKPFKEDLRVSGTRLEKAYHESSHANLHELGENKPIEKPVTRKARHVKSITYVHGHAITNEHQAEEDGSPQSARTCCGPGWCFGGRSGILFRAGRLSLTLLCKTRIC